MLFVDLLMFVSSYIQIKSNLWQSCDNIDGNLLYKYHSRKTINRRQDMKTKTSLSFRFYFLIKTKKGNYNNKNKAILACQ